MTSKAHITLLLFFCIAAIHTAPLSADDTTQIPSDVQARVRELDEQIAGSKQAVSTLQNQLLESRRELSRVDLKLQPLLGELEAIELHRRKSEETIEQQRELARKARGEYDASSTAAVELRKQIEALQAKLAEAEKKQAEAKATAEKADQQIVQLHQEMAGKAHRIGPLTVATKEPTEQRSIAEQQTVALEQQLSQIEEQQRQFKQAIEDELKAAGQWVSFSQKIAPIIHNRCLVCHNARTPRGGYSMHSFVNLMGEGDSGAAIVPGDVEESWLVELIESGEMPVDAHPLSPEQVELFRRWIALGSRLDVTAEPGAALVELIPRPEMSVAPVEYPVAPPVTALASTVIDGQSLLASSGYREVLLWSFDGTLQRRVGNMLERVYGLDFSPDGRWLAVASGTPGQLGDVSVYDSRSGELLSHLVLADDSVLDVAWSPDGQRIAVAAADGKLSVFEVSPSDAVTANQSSQPSELSQQVQQGQQGQLIIDRLFTIAVHADWINAIAWSSDGRWLATASRDKTAKVFDAKTGRGVVTYAEHEAEVVDIEFMSSGDLLVSADVSGKELRIWNAANGRQIRKIPLGNRTPVAIKRLDADSVLVAVATGQLLTCHVDQGELSSEIQLGNGWLSSILVGGEGTLWSGDQSGQIQRFDRSQDAVQKRWLCQP